MSDGATHRCVYCGARWILWPPDPNHPVKAQRDGSWSLASGKCGQCCDNVAMGHQIVPLPPSPTGDA